MLEPEAGQGRRVKSNETKAWKFVPAAAASIVYAEGF
jgi:hypothetical protein